MEHELGMPQDLYIVRHGQSTGNLARKKYVETNDESVFLEIFAKHESKYELTSLGIEQAKLTGSWFLNNGLSFFDRMLVSSNDRALQTASYLGLPEAAWMIDSNLREREDGLFNIIPPTKRDSDYADQQKFHDTEPFLFRPPQGENMADVCQRIKIVLDTLARECSGKRVIIVCHGHVIRAFRIILERMSLQKSNEFLLTQEDWGKIPNCSILHYTRKNPFIPENLGNNLTLSNHFDWFRMIRPAGGGKLEDNFSEIKRKKYTNEELLLEVSGRNVKK
jgi:broad specificity phosphatase PhoE